MHKAILVYAHIDEGAKRRHVSHRPFQHHAGLQVVQGFDTVRENRGLESRTRIAARLFQLAKNVADSRQAEGIVDEILRRESAQCHGVADEPLHVGLRPLDDPAHHRIGFRMYARGFERIFTAGYAQETGALFESLWPQTWHVLQRLARSEWTVGVAVKHDVLPKTRSDT